MRWHRSTAASGAHRIARSGNLESRVALPDALDQRHLEPLERESHLLRLAVAAQGHGTVRRLAFAHDQQIRDLFAYLRASQPVNY